MPMPCYLSLKGNKQGKIEGSVDIEGHVGKILVHALDHKIEMPTNPQTGQPMGKRVHQGIVLTKEIDQSSPKLFQALNTGERVEEAILEFYRTTSSGQEEKYYIIELTNATLFSARTWVPNILQPEFEKMGPMENFGIVYEKITWTWTAKGIQYVDSFKK